MEPNTTILLELPLTSIIRALEECTGYSKNAMKEILTPLTDTQPDLVLTKDGRWVQQEVMYPNDPKCTVE